MILMRLLPKMEARHVKIGGPEVYWNKFVATKCLASLDVDQVLGQETNHDQVEADLCTAARRILTPVPQSKVLRSAAILHIHPFHTEREPYPLFLFAPDLRLDRTITITLVEINFFLAGSWMEREMPDEDRCDDLLG